ncbi:amidohydrolase family protein [Nocardioides sp. W7]|uniref:dihydroorotase n=1 Tax=Nocardioides sp. W7 TaxID=2931390 RepID=UPI001FD0A0B7|nr:amidohydrolase family protein [Nocardioides sp. W7]
MANDLPDLRLHGGKVFVHGSGLVDADILVKDGTVVGLVDASSPALATETLDVSGQWVLPGAIDPHVHLGKDIRVPKDPDDADLESASAVAGGITSMLVYLMSSESYAGVHEAADGAMAGNSRVNYGFHYVLGTDEHLAELPSYVKDLGVSSFKFFMNFRDDEGAYLGMPGNDDGFMYDLLGLSADHGAMINPHPENIELVRRLAGRTLVDPDHPLRSWNAARPPLVEADAQQRVAYLAAATGASVYAVHTSSGAALDVVRRQRESYENLFVETCTHYLTLSTDSGCGSYGKVNPPLRDPADVEALWAGVADGSVDTVGSDHNARHRSHKEKDIFSATAGFPGTGVVLPLTLAEGLARGIGLERLVDATSTRSAKLFGLYPRKGTIQVGSDADLVVVDPTGGTVIDAATQYSAAEYTPWQGTRVDPKVVHTVVGGTFAVRNGRLTDERPGSFLHRPRSGASALAATTPTPQEQPS